MGTSIFGGVLPDRRASKPDSVLLIGYCSSYHIFSVLGGRRNLFFDVCVV